MAKAFSGDVGAFLPTTTIFDESQLRQTNVNSQEFKEFLVNLLQVVNNIALITNIKESAYYYPQEFVTGGVYFPNPTLNSKSAQTPIGRQVVRDVVNVGALLNAAPTSTNHHITFNSSLIGVRVYGCATNPGVGFAPIPNSDVKVTVTATQIVVSPSTNYSAYTTCFAVIEYITS